MCAAAAATAIGSATSERCSCLTPVPAMCSAAPTARPSSWWPRRVRMASGCTSRGSTGCSRPRSRPRQGPQSGQWSHLTEDGRRSRLRSSCPHSHEKLRMPSSGVRPVTDVLDRPSSTPAWRIDQRRPAWPGLPWPERQDTMSTLHLWTQVIGKVRLTLMPPANHWWHVPLYVTPDAISLVH